MVSGVVGADPTDGVEMERHTCVLMPDDTATRQRCTHPATDKLTGTENNDELSGLSGDDTLIRSWAAMTNLNGGD